MTITDIKSALYRVLSSLAIPFYLNGIDERALAFARWHIIPTIGAYHLFRQMLHKFMAQ
jgi:hypothetical protein